MQDNKFYEKTVLVSLNSVKKCAEKAGFNLCGVVKSTEVREYDSFFMEWIEQKKCADMTWVDKNHSLRRNPSILHETTRSIIVVGLNYHKKNYSKEVSMLANGVDYHYVVKKMLLKFSELLEKELNHKFNYKMCVDSAPITEKYWAYKAGLGWIGRNSLIVNKEYGSFFVLGELLVDFETDNYDTCDEFDGCGKCKRCENVCPTAALNNKRVDCRKCLAYLTIEHRAEFNDSQLEMLSRNDINTFFGCDICQNICPWNIKAISNFNDSKYVTIDKLFNIKELIFNKDEFIKISSNQFKQKYKHTALFRTGLKKIITNINAID